MGKKNENKDIEEVKARLRAENPDFTEEELDEMAEQVLSGKTESFADSQGQGGELEKELETKLKVLEGELAAVEDEKEKLAAERAEFEKEKAALAAERVTLEELKAETDAERIKAGGSREKTGKEVTYICETRCTFDGVYFKEGDILVTSKDVPEFFKPAK